MNPLIQIENLVYQPAGWLSETRPILKGIDLKIEVGELVAIIGANGCGKTTLARHLNALHLPTSGEVLINGMNTRNKADHPKIRALTGMVFQQPEDQIVAAIVEEDVAFGPENLCRLPALIRNQVENALEQVSMLSQRQLQPSRLSAGQVQRVALAGVLAMQPELIIFDEATAMLDPAGRRDVLNTMLELNQAGITILFITHDMEEVNLAKRVVLLDQGSVKFDGTPPQLFSNPEMVLACGLELPFNYQLYQTFPGWFQERSDPLDGIERLFELIPKFDATEFKTSHFPKKLSPDHQFEIEIHGLNFSYPAEGKSRKSSLKDVELMVPSGRAHGIVGATGSGKSTLLQHLNGLFLPQTGQVRIGQFDLNAADVDLLALRRYAGMVFQNPENYFFNQYVGDEVAYGIKLRDGRVGLKEKVRDAMEMAGLDFDRYKDRIVTTLSGGEQRKTALAAALALNPKLLILDEPTAGLDPRSRRMVLTKLKELESSGVQLVITSHNMEDIAEIAKNVTVLADGQSVASDSTGGIFADEIRLEQAGLQQPDSVKFANALRQKGWPLSRAAVTFDQILSELERLKSGAGDESI